MKKIILLSLFGLLSFYQSWSQTLSNNPAKVMYFECSDLDFNKYSALHENVKSDGHFIIETACSPAHVLCVTTANTRSTAEAFKQLAALSGIQSIVERQQYTRVDFDNRCAAARTGN